MQDARNENASRLFPVKHDVLVMLHAPEAVTDIVTASAYPWIFRKHLATSFKLVHVTSGLYFAPCVQGVIANTQQVRLSATRDTKRSHWLASRRAKLECL